MNTAYLLLASLILSFIAYRTLTNKTSYAKFKQYKNTADRQKTYKFWIIESFAMFMGLTAIVLVMTGNKFKEVLAEVNSSTLGTFFGQNQAVIAGFVAALIFGVIIGAIAEVKNKDNTSPVAGDIEAMLPKNNPELKLTAIMSINAGVVEELFFRLALPALLFAATSNVTVAVIASIVVFGLVHWYQGWVGVISTAFIGALLMAVYLATNNLLLAIMLHIFIDMRSLVLVPYLRIRTRNQ